MGRIEDDDMMDTERPDAAALCPCCLAPNEPAAHFCQQCGTPMSSAAEIDPMGRIRAQGDTFRKAASAPTRPIMLIGMWLIFAPQVPFMVWGVIDSIAAPKDLETILRLLLFVGAIALYVAILWKVTRNYILHRRRHAPPEADEAADE